jgi:hypothetical protein
MTEDINQSNLSNRKRPLPSDNSDDSQEPSGVSAGDRRKHLKRENNG